MGGVFVFFFRMLRNLLLIVILFFIGCYFANGRETLENISRVVEDRYGQIVSSDAYEKVIDGIFP